MKLNEFVKFNRKRMKMNQAEIALKCGLGLHFMRELEQGKKHFVLIRSIKYLFFGDMNLVVLKLEKRNPIIINSRRILWHYND